MLESRMHQNALILKRVIPNPSSCLVEQWHAHNHHSIATKQTTPMMEMPLIQSICLAYLKAYKNG
jgi:hypothetical protein